MGSQVGMRKERRGERRSKGGGGGGGMMNAGTGLAIGVVAVVGVGLLSKFVSRLRQKPKDPDVKVVDDIVNGEPAKNQSVQAQVQAEKLLVEAAAAAHEVESKGKEAAVDDDQGSAAEKGHADDDDVHCPKEIRPDNMAPSPVDAATHHGSLTEEKEGSYAQIKPILPSAAYESSSGLCLDPGKQDSRSGFNHSAHGSETLDREEEPANANEQADQMKTATNIPTKEFTTGTRVSSNTRNEGILSSTDLEEALNSSKGEFSECPTSGRLRPQRQSGQEAHKWEPSSQILQTELEDTLPPTLDNLTSTSTVHNKLSACKRSVSEPMPQHQMGVSVAEALGNGGPVSEFTDKEIGISEKAECLDTGNHKFAENSDDLKDAVIEKLTPEMVAEFERERANLVETLKAQELWNGRDLSREGGIAQLLDGKEEAACLQLKSLVVSSIGHPQETAKGVEVEEVVKRNTLLAPPAVANGSAVSLVYKIEETSKGLIVEEVVKRPKLLPLPAEGDFTLSDKQVLGTRKRTSRKCGFLKMLPVQLQIIVILLVFMSIIYVLLWRHQNLLTG